MSKRPTLEISNLYKSYGALNAVNGISLSVAPGETFGLLGPNGAGKTSSLELAVGVRQPDRGQIRICGLDTATELQAIYQLIGVQLQSTQLYERLQVGELIQLFAGYYRAPAPVKELIRFVELESKWKEQIRTLSGGQAQRLSLALALVNNPSVVFLDEPTTGLDPQSKHRLWDLIRDMRTRGSTVILATHNMEEAEKLCDRVAVIDHGVVIAEGPPRNLILKHGGNSTVTFGLVCRNGDASLEKENLEQIPGVQNVIVTDGKGQFQMDNALEIISPLMKLTDENQFDLRELRIQAPTLEDVFLNLTGRSLRE